jgi:DNA mismatch repair protein MutH
VKTFKDLLDRLAVVQGVPFAELCQVHGIKWYPEPARNKGLAAKVVETVLEVRTNNRPEPDLTNLGLEIKTIPVTDDLGVMEHTKVTTLNFRDVEDQDWERSTVYHKLRSILFVPVVKYDKASPERWYVRSPFVWFPSLEAEKQLREDYEAVRSLVKQKQYAAISSSEPPSGQGIYLMANTGGIDSGDLTKVEGAAGAEAVKRRAWMLRKSFTRRVLSENVRYTLPTPGSETSHKQTSLPTSK